MKSPTNLLMGEPPVPISQNLLETYIRSFDSEYYARQYGPFDGRQDLARHYLELGWIEGRNPCEWFDGFNYFIANPDVEARGINPFIHFLGWGMWEGRKFSPFPSPQAAIRMSLGLEGLDWTSECRKSVDAAFYRQEIASLYRSDRVDIYAHYAFAGWRMGLKPYANWTLSDDDKNASESFGINPLIYQRHSSQSRRPQKGLVKTRDSATASSQAELLPLKNEELFTYLYSLLASAVSSKVEACTLRYEPINQIVGLGAFKFRSTGDDPQFQLIPETDLSKGGWFEFQLDISSKAIVEPFLYVAVARDWSVFHQMSLGRSRPGGQIRTGIYLPPGAQFLRLDPADFECEFELRACALRSLDPAEIWRQTRHLFKDRDTGPLLKAALNALAPVPVAWLDKTSHCVGASYADWLQRYSIPDEDDVRRIADALEKMEFRPLISIVMATYNTPADFLRAAIDSVRSQIYENWELCIADDASTNQAVQGILQESAKADSRIKVTFRATNGNISNATNSALELAVGEYIAFMDHDDIIYPHALAAVVSVLNKNRDIAFLYSDEDKIDEADNRHDPHFKSDWNPELFLNQNYINHLSVVRNDLIEAAGGFRIGFEGSQDYDFLLRLLFLLPNQQIAHIPLLLYGWRVFKTSQSFSQTKARRAKLASLLALSDFISQKSIHGEVIEPTRETFRIKRLLPPAPPLVSIIIPTKDKLDLLRQCILGILHTNAYQNFEIIVVDNNSEEPETLAYFEELAQIPKCKVLRYTEPFNYSAINNFAAKAAVGEFLLLLNNDIRMINDAWLEELVCHGLQKEVGIVGSKLLYENDTIQHAGIIVGLGGVAGHSHKYFRRSDPGYFRRLEVAQDLSGVTAGCLLIKKAIFFQVGGLDEENLKIAFNDVDLCLKVRQAGYRVVFNPFSLLYHLESVSRGDDSAPEKVQRFNSEIEFMKRKWSNRLINDPFYSPNLTLAREDFSIAWPPRVTFRDFF